MLNLWFTRPITSKFIAQKDFWFSYIFKNEWMQDTLIQEACMLVKNHKYLGDGIWKTPYGHNVGPSQLPGTLKTLIMAWNMPDEIFPITYVGPAAKKALKLLTDNKDLNFSNGSVFYYEWEPDQLVRLMEVENTPIINVNELVDYLDSIGRVKDAYTDLIWEWEDAT